MRIALVLVGLAAISAATFGAGGAEGKANGNGRTKGLSFEQIRGVMRANARAFNTCLRTATRSGHELHGPFLYQIEVDKDGKVTAARPYQPSALAAFDKCVTAVLKRARFPGGPASVEA